MLCYTKVELELITDIDMYLMIKKGFRGGVSMISHKYMPKTTTRTWINVMRQSQAATSCIMMQITNTAWAMSQCLPKGEFKWVEEEELTQLNVTQIEKDAEKGYILEVDLKHPTALHNLHNDYPVAPESKTLAKEELSAYSQGLLEELGMRDKPTEKLIQNLYPKTKYVVHYQNLQQYLELGLKLTRINRAVSFSQSKWLEPYIALNTEKRKAAKNLFEKDFYKLMNNSVFGKTMENMQKRINIKLCTFMRNFKSQNPSSIDSRSSTKSSYVFI